MIHPRHTDLRIFEVTGTKERLFSGWAMHVGSLQQVEPELVWRCVESFQRPSPERAVTLIEALTHSVQGSV